MKTVKSLFQVKKDLVYFVEKSPFLSKTFDINLLLAQKLAESKNCDYIIIIESSSKFSAKKKGYYLKEAHSKESSFVEVENATDYIRSIRDKYNMIPLSCIQEDVSKTEYYAKLGDYDKFRHYIPSFIRSHIGKRLMNEIRAYYSLSPIVEQVKFDIDTIREQYHAKQIYNIGDIVESNDELYEVLERGANYLVVINTQGHINRKWLQDVVMSEHTNIFADSQFEPEETNIPNEISFKGYTTKNLHRAPGANEAFAKTIRNMQTTDPLSILNALKYTDEYLSLTPEDILKGGVEEQGKLVDWNASHTKAKQSLDRCGEFINHIMYWHAYKDLLDKAVMAVRINTDASSIKEEVESPREESDDKQRIAELVKKLMGIDGQIVSPEAIINDALKKSINFDKAKMSVLAKMVDLADEVGISYDKKLLPSVPKLTTEQVLLGMNHSIKYGRRFPNPIDVSWVIKEGKAPPIEIRKGEVGSAASLRPDDEKKLKIMNDPERAGAQLTGQIGKDDAKKIENYANTGSTDGIKRAPGHDQPEYTHIGSSLTADGNDTLARMKARKIMHNESADDCDDCDIDMTEQDIDKLIDQISDEDLMDIYDEDEFSVVDVESGEECEEEKPVSEETLIEVLSKIERMKARLRFSRNQPKIQRARMLALKKHSDSKKINKRARHLAVNLMRKKLLKGRPESSVSTNEKERIDRIIEKRKKFIGRMAIKLTQKVRQLEKERLSHKNYTKD